MWISRNRDGSINPYNTPCNVLKLTIAFLLDALDVLAGAGIDTDAVTGVDE